MSARYAGIVANPPPYIVRMTQKIADEERQAAGRARVGADAYSSIPSAKNTV